MSRNQILLLLVFPFFAAASYGESDFERELKQLVEQRDKARAAAIAPIDAKFKVAAEQLLRRATQLGDLEAANKIKAAIGGALPRGSAKTVASLREYLLRTKWQSDPKAARRPGLPENLTFTEKTIEPGGQAYEIDSPDTLTITFPKGDKQSMTVKNDGKRLEFTFRGKEHAYEVVSE